MIEIFIKPSNITDSGPSDGQGTSDKNPEPRLCPVLLSKGKRKGTPCNRKLSSEETEACKFHSAKAESTDVCTVILTKGERKNQPCNRKVLQDGLCKLHYSREQDRPKNPYTEKEFDCKLDSETGQMISKMCVLNIADVDLLCSSDKNLPDKDP